MMRFAPEYVDHVLSPNFEDAKRFFFEHLMDLHYAHLLMLHKAGIVSSENAKAIADSLSGINPETITDMPFDGTFEDLFYCVEDLLAKRCGQEIAGQLHTARSRNDIDVTLYRLKWRKDLLGVQQAALDLRQCLVELCAREKESILPLYTHTQPAQPSTIAHYFLGIVEHLERDQQRLRNAFATMNRCPLGACAITGTGFPIDRFFTSELLGFDKPTGNTYGSIAGVDYILETIGSLMTLLTNLSKVVQDLLLWSTLEFRALVLSDEYVQASSIMPQKRNPVSLEHSRALISRSLGQASAIFQMLHNTPYGDIVDVEDDLQPLVHRVFADTRAPLKVLTGALSKARFDRAHLLQKSHHDWITVTELADTLVRTEGIAFRASHSIVRLFVGRMAENPDQAPYPVLQKTANDFLGRPVHLSEGGLKEALSPEQFVARRATRPGGPAIAVVEEAILQSRTKIMDDGQWLQDTVSRLATRHKNLRKLASQLSMFHL